MFEQLILSELQTLFGFDGHIRNKNVKDDKFNGIKEGCFFYIYLNDDFDVNSILGHCTANVTESYTLVIGANEYLNYKRITLGLIELGYNLNGKGSTDSIKIYNEETGQNLMKCDRKYFKIIFSCTSTLDTSCCDSKEIAR